MAEFYGGHDTGGNDITLEEEEEEDRISVAKGQYVVSDTRCPALHGCKLE